LTLFPFKSFSTFSTFSSRLDIPIGAENFFFLGNSRPLLHVHINETPNRFPLRQNASFKPSCTFVPRSVRQLRECEKNMQKRIKGKKSQSRYISRMRGEYSHSTDCNGSSHVGLGYLHYQSCQWLSLYVQGFGFSEEQNLGFSYRKLTWPLQHCLALPLRHVMVAFRRMMAFVDSVTLHCQLNVC
jgi:hypothetical protein